MASGFTLGNRIRKRMGLTPLVSLSFLFYPTFTACRTVTEELELLTTLADCSSIRDVEITACMRGRIGGYSEEGTPVPIPNTVVKLFSSDDTVGAAPWENRASPLHPLKWAVI